MWRDYLNKVVEYFGGVTEWDDHGYQRIDAQRHQKYYYVALAVTVAAFFSWVVDGSIAGAAFFVLSLLFLLWAWMLKSKRPMVDALFPKTRGTGAIERDNPSIYMDFPSVVDRNIDDIPYHKSIGEVLQLDEE